jgi:hypothetical protein
MRFLFVLAFLTVAPVLLAGPPSAQSWSNLAQTVQPDWNIRAVMPDGTAVDGRPARFEAEALIMRVVHTSDKSLHPKGEIAIPRAQVKVLGICRNGYKGRLMGTWIPVGAGIGIGVGLALSTDKTNMLSGLEAAAGLGFGLAVAATGGTAGYFIGRSADRRFETVTVTAP